MEKQSIPTKAIDLQQMASKNKSRGVLQAVHFDKGRVVAGDGHSMVVCKLEPNQDIPEGNIRFDFKLKQADRKYPSMVFNKISETEYLSERGKAEVIKETYPNYEQLIPKHKKSIVICFNVEKLMQLSKILNADGRSHVVEIELNPNMEKLDNLLVTGCDEDAFGVLAPCRTSGKSPQETVDYVLNNKGK